MVWRNELSLKEIFLLMKYYDKDLDIWVSNWISILANIEIKVNLTFISIFDKGYPLKSSNEWQIEMLSL